jgi:hypothetical protein
MSEAKKKQKVRISNWAQVAEEEKRILHQIYRVGTSEGVEAAVAWATYLRKSGLNAESYPLFLRLLDIENHWVADALLEGAEPEVVFNGIPSNRFLVENAYRMLTKRPPGGIYVKTLAALLGILKKAYSDPKNGYHIYPLTIADVDNLGKHLDSKGGQDDSRNRIILETLEKIGQLKGEPPHIEMEAVAKQAEKIRAAFFDNRKTLTSAIPDNLIVRGNYRASEVHPQKLYVH